MKFPSLSLAALVLALAAPVNAQSVCGGHSIIGSDGDCEDFPKVTVSLVTIVPDGDNPGETVEVVVAETEDEGDFDPDNETSELR